MEVLKSNMVLDQLQAYREDQFDLNSTYLWIWNPSAIPPHMGISADGSYFSLKANGLDFDSSLSDLIDIIQRKKLCVVAVELKTDMCLSTLKSEFSQFERTIAHEITCLNPIKNVLGFPETGKLVELLSELRDANTIGTFTSWNLSENSLELADYSTKDIHKHLVSLSK